MNKKTKKLDLIGILIFIFMKHKKIYCTFYCTLLNRRYLENGFDSDEEKDYYI